KETAQDLGVDWQANYLALLGDMGLRNFRLMSYWSQIEAERGTYNFDDLDWQFAEAEKVGAKITLSVGLRQPRWPECHQANWAKELYEKDYFAWEKELYAFISTVVDRYKDSPSLESWHLENEYYNRNFGNCDNFSTKRLKEELDLIHEHDSDNPVVISLSDQLGFPLKGLKGDFFATSLYRGNHVKVIGYVPYPIPTHFYSAKAFFIKLLRGRDIYIHELQLEPWGAKPTRDLPIAEQDRLMGYDQIVGNIRFGLQTGMKKMYLWGSEWWYWRKVKLQDPSVWNAVKTEVNKY
ncbi:MAG: beta-galactosidase, partial [Patescibacteria group bacterium]